MTLAFKLSMPGVGSWNGKWSQEGQCFAIIKSFVGKRQIDKATALVTTGSYGYDFGDGWFARVHVERVDAAKARALRKQSKGFCGYDWMVASILDHGKIQI